MDMQDLAAGTPYEGQVGIVPASIMLRVYDGLAEILSQTAQSLIAPDGLPNFGIELRSDADVVAAFCSPIATECLELALSRTFIPQAHEMAQRAQELAACVIQRRPAEHVSRFLARVSRCYIVGFDSECVVMCRAVLDTALVEVFDREQIQLPGRMRERLDAAKSMRWLTAAGVENAWAVWHRGNKAIHQDPDAVQDVLGTVQATMVVLSELYDR